jgi:release factor glutamine methyltransferase
LFAGADGLAGFREVVPEIARLLAWDGVSVLELGAGQLDRVTGLLNQAGLFTGPVRFDLAGIPRALPAAKSATRLQIDEVKKKVGKSRIPV